MGDVSPSALASCVPCDMQAALGFIVGVALTILLFVLLHHILKD